MKFFHTADWHLGKLVQGVYMTDDQHYILRKFLEVIVREKPDAVVIAGDLYDRAVPPPEAVRLLDDMLERIVVQLKTPVIVIAGNHDSPSRLGFGGRMMKEQGFHVVSQFDVDEKPVILQDEYGEVHFHLVPFCDPSIVRNAFQDNDIKSHQDAMQKIVKHKVNDLTPEARHVFVGHAFVTPNGEKKDNTSESERPLSIGGAEQVDAHLFTPFHYTALGHLHQAHKVGSDHIRYAGSPLKYSISEENHHKGFYIVEMDGDGVTHIEKETLIPRRDMRTVTATLDELFTLPVSKDYVYVRLLDEVPVLSPMEKVRSVFPNAMHVGLASEVNHLHDKTQGKAIKRTTLTDTELFKSFYLDVKGAEVTPEVEAVLNEVMDDLLKAENETDKLHNTSEQTSD